MAEGAVRVLDVVVFAEPQDRQDALPPDRKGLRRLRRGAEFGEQVAGRLGSRQVERLLLAVQQRPCVALCLGDLVEMIHVPVAQRLVAALVLLHDPLSLSLSADKPAALLPHRPTTRGPATSTIAGNRSATAPAAGRTTQEGKRHAFTGKVLDNPISGERFVFHQTASDTGGQLLAFDLVLTPDGHVPGGHVHPVQEERFQVLRGTMKFRKGLRTVVAEAGEEVVVPPGSYHRFANAGAGLAVVRVARCGRR